MSLRPCPRCRLALVTLTHEGVEVDHCACCGGTWLDAGEEAPVLGPCADPQVWQEAGVAQERGVTRLRCPVDGQPLACYEVNHLRETVEVDRCKACGGLWLDAGEGVRVRDLVTAANQSERAALARKPGIWSYLVQVVSGFPIEVWNPVRRTPWLTYSLLGLLLLVFFGQVALQVSGGQAALDALFRAYGFMPALIDERPWTLLTYALLHDGLLHLAANLYFLYVFSDNIEDLLGRGYCAIIFIASAIGGALIESLSSPFTIVVGASGAIAGLMGAYVILFPHVQMFVVIAVVRVRLRVGWYMGMWVGMQLLIATSTDARVAWLTHLGGFATGLLMAAPFRRRTLDAMLRRRARRLARVVT